MTGRNLREVARPCLETVKDGRVPSVPRQKEKTSRNQRRIILLRVTWVWKGFRHLLWSISGQFMFKGLSHMAKAL
jgi:hypothetical protein